MGVVDNRLHIEELKNKFKNSKQISIDDFYEFYKDVFGEIKKNTVSWHIYELKKKRIVRSVSRGQYILEDADRDEVQEYIVITMDIIKSSELDYSVFNQKLKEKVHSINIILQKKYEFNRIYNISQGDEIQILLPFNENIGYLLMLTLGFLYPFEVRYGISIGEVNDKIERNSWEMNGPIFWNARDQLEKLKNKKNYNGLIISGYNQTDRLCNNILPLINRAIKKITEKQWEAIKCEVANMDLDNALEEIKISKTSYYERLNVSNLEEIILSFKAIYDLMKIRRIIN